MLIGPLAKVARGPQEGRVVLEAPVAPKAVEITLVAITHIMGGAVTTAQRAQLVSEASMGCQARGVSRIFHCLRR